MNIWQYFDNLSKRKYVMKQLKSYKKERNEYAQIWQDISPRLTSAYLGIVKKLDIKITFYEDKLNDYL